MKMAGRLRVRLAIVGVALAVLSGGAYLGVGVILFDGISRVDPSCGTVGTSARFADVTPATLHYTASDFGPTDTAAPVLLALTVESGLWL
jgi:hypothetical protein